MTLPADGAVESGQGYSVAEIDGRRPKSLDDFTGEIYLTLTRNNQVLHVSGSGSRSEGAARFYQKDLTLHDRDIRVWTITESDDTTFLAAPYAAF